MSLLHPGAWPVLLAAPLAALLLWALDRARARRLARAVGPRARVLANAAPRAPARVLFAAALLLALLALLQPVWGEPGETAEPGGIDLVVCLDVSRSMLARDVAPSRLARAHREIAALAEHAAGDRLGLVVFAGEARLVVPLTRDRDTFRELAARTGPLSVERGGTDLGAALETALAALGAATGEHEAILLLTDGEDHEERGLRAARACAGRGIAVHCVGLGSERGAKIPLDIEGGGEAFLRDDTGAEVVSALRQAPLQAIAAVAGGTCAAQRPLTELYEEELAPMARKSLEARTRRARPNRYQWPLLAALLLWILELCLHERRR